jgi:type 1 glutamine amidotransferase
MDWRASRAMVVGMVAGWLLSAGACVGVCQERSGVARPASRIRALILSGGEGRGQSATTRVLAAILADSGRFDVAVCESPAGISRSTFSNSDLVVVNIPLVAGSETERAVSAFAEAGNGVLFTRGAFNNVGAPGPWPLTAGSGQPQPVRFLDANLVRPDHPIVRGMPSRFRTADAVPNVRAAHPSTDVIATVDAAGQAVPVLAASGYGKGRTVAFALGIDPSAMHEPQFRAMMARAGEWAVSGAVTLPPALGPSGPGRDSVKALLITGGHDHDAAFYGLFRGYTDIGRLPVDTAAGAFKKDLRGKYDVIIMYDFTRDLDENGRKNLRDFVESGKGVVVLHHALLNYQTWSWWSEDVVGGRYRLQREGVSPSSSVKDSQEIYVTPVVPHPILDGIHPFHITDEAYKNLFMSPRIKPLLVTDNPTSDTNLAWVGPSEKYRVVAIQLGHGASAFGHPAYRALVHNAILWAARRAG